SSTRNTRIERMWVEVGTQFAMRWRAFFTRLERTQHLRPDEEGHLWVLHSLFLEDINADCCAFQRDWNHHPLSGAGRNQSPLDMRFLAQLDHGVVSGNDLDDIHPDVLSRYYGADVDEGEDQRSRSGAGNYSDDDDHDSDERGDHNSEVDVTVLDDRLTSDQQQHIRHAPIPVPDGNSPFSNVGFEEVFFRCLAESVEKKVIPAGFRVYGENDAHGGPQGDSEEYEDVEYINIGRSGRRVPVTLPYDIWQPRILKWAQGLEIMAQLLMLDKEGM
ncbi:hypothetical protein FKP32DRAFT_1582987, partial [Trametes sanguinea]